jgi:phosphoglycerol transferase MdoB-like AlkP superfamily enzyme
MPASPTRLADWLAPCAAAALYAKLMAYNALISPGHTPLPQAEASLASIVALAVVFVLLLPARWRFWAILGLDALLSVGVVADVWYLRYFDDVMPARSLMHGSLALGVNDSVLALARWADVWFVADVALLLALAPWRHAPVRWRGWPARTRLAGLGAVALVAVATLADAIADFDRRHPNALVAAWNPRYIAASLGGLTYHGVDAFNTLAVALRPPASAGEVDAIAEWLRRRDAARPADPAWGVARGKNLIVVQVEALQQFALHRTVGHAPLTPHLDALAAESLYFPNVYGQTKGGNTSDAEFMANTGLYPVARGAAFVRFAGNHYRSMALALKGRGYHTVAMHANAPAFWNRYAMYPAIGFDAFRSEKDYVQDERVGLGLSDRSFLTQSLAALEAMPQPFMASLVTLSSHHPYTDSPAFGDFDPGRFRGTLLGDYMRAIHYTDAQLGMAIARLKRDGLWNSSVVVIYGDHPAIHRPARPALEALLGLKGDTELGWLKLQKVPFLLHVPGGPTGTRQVTGGQMDLYPTVGSVLGVPTPGAFGQSLLAAHPEGGTVVFRDGSAIVGGTYFAADDERAFDLATEAAIADGAIGERLAAARESLRTSDRILSNDLIPRLASKLGGVAPEAYNRKAGEARRRRSHGELGDGHVGGGVFLVRRGGVRRAQGRS